MTVALDQVPELVSRLLSRRPVRWAPRERLVGDYDGRERTLEVFNAEPGEQRALLRSLRGRRADIQTAAGGSLVVVFHTIRESRRLYADFLRDWDQRHETAPSRYQTLARQTRDWMSTDHSGDPGFDPDAIEPITIEAA